MSASQRRKGATFEREIAKVFGTERVGSRGKSDNEHCDVAHPHLFIECKRYQRIAVYRWWDKCSAGAAKVGKTPMLVIREDRAEPLVVMRLADVVALTDV